MGRSRALSVVSHRRLESLGGALVVPLGDHPPVAVDDLESLPGQELVKMKQQAKKHEAIKLSSKEMDLLREELDIDDEMNEDDEENKAEVDDPYFLLAQRLANAPQVKVTAHLREEGEVVPGSEDPDTLEDSEKKCPVCQASVSADVVEHVKVQHPEVDGVVCPHCCKILSKKCTLNRHIEQVHLGLQIFKPAKCMECGKVFSKKGHLDRHVRTIHMGQKDESEPCPHCGKIFTTKSSLEPHIEAVHKGVRKECVLCGKVLSDLWKHMRTVHGKYRRKTKIPKDEVFGATAGNKHPETAEQSPPEEAAKHKKPVKKPLQTKNSLTKSSPNKRKTSLPLKVKMSFKMAGNGSGGNKSRTKDEGKFSGQDDL